MKQYLIIPVLLFISSFGFSQADDIYTQEPVYIGAANEFKTLSDFFKDDRSNVHVIVEEGTYYSAQDLWISGKNIIIEGRGNVNIYCTELYSNVMWVSGNNIIIKNLHMKHFKPGEPEGQNCSGRVLAFDNASNVIVENCDLNGCGLAGLHDNTGNSNILVKNCYIHNNSQGAYTDIDGGVWLEAVDDHPVFKFQNNRMENNGADRIPEE